MDCSKISAFVLLLQGCGIPETALHSGMHASSISLCTLESQMLKRSLMQAPKPRRQSRANCHARMKFSERTHC